MEARGVLTLELGAEVRGVEARGGPYPRKGCNPGA